jgi:hypothetical protein
MVVIQVFYAGVAVLVQPGNWQAHTTFGHLLSLPVMLMAILSLLGWMPVRFFLLSLGLYVLYTLQHVLIYLPRQGALPTLAARDAQRVAEDHASHRDGADAGRHYQFAGAAPGAPADRL